jgi:hypothetical protein
MHPDELLRLAAPGLRSVDQRPIGQGIDRFALDWSEVDD